MSIGRKMPLIFQLLVLVRLSVNKALELFKKYAHNTGMGIL
jgi:hypothetical protein